MIDLHVHSNASFDSTEEVATIIELAKKQGIKTLSITDHNSVKGTRIACNQNEVEVISGIEIDCTYQDYVVHVLGYYIDVNDPIFDELEVRYQNALKDVQAKRLEQLSKLLDCTITHEEMVAYAKKDNYTNVEIMQYLFEKKDHALLKPYTEGNKKENALANFYWDYMSKGKIAYSEMDLPTLEEVIHWIRRSGGIAVLAHPKMNVPQEPWIFEELKGLGIEGLEVYCNYHDVNDVAFYEMIVETYDWVATCGSDFHGYTKPNIQLGKHGYEQDGVLIKERLKNARDHRAIKKR